MMMLPRDVASSDTAMAATRTTDQDLKPSEPSPLLRLPLELRRQIYRLNLLDYSRSPSAEAIYLRRLSSDSKDPPSPLLLVNCQIRDEVVDMVQRYPITLRVTHQGIQFDSLAETCFIAQRSSRDYGRIPHLVIDIWPPHPDRPTDVIDIWRHLRKLRTELRGVPLLQQVSLFFADNEMAAWTHNGKALDLLDRHDENPSIAEWGYNDVTYIMDLFARVSAEKASFHLPRGLTTGKTTDHVRDWLRSTNAYMMGRIPIDDDVYSEEDENEADVQDCVDELREFVLQRKGAEIARDKLDAMTSCGRCRLTPGEWENFIAIWSPDFESLGPDGFKGMRHYVDTDDPYDYEHWC